MSPMTDVLPPHITIMVAGRLRITNGLLMDYGWWWQVVASKNDSDSTKCEDDGLA